MTTAYFSHPDCRGHDMGNGHPECPARLDAIEDHLLATGLDVALTRFDVPLADHADLALAYALAPWGDMIGYAWVWGFGSLLFLGLGGLLLSRRRPAAG